MIKRILFHVILGTTLISSSFAQNNRFTTQWKMIDSLMEKGLPRSAAEIAEVVRQKAENQGNLPNLIKANLFLMQVEHMTKEDATVENIQKSEGFIKNTTGVEQAVWRSITAERYWNYFLRNRWKIYNRTSISENTPADVKTWAPADFFRKISELYVASLENPVVLKETPIENYAPLIIEGENTRQLRPSMYDLLAFRAIRYFENDEKDLVRPANTFQIDDADWFQSSNEFITIPLPVHDSLSLHWQALNLYQNVLKKHLQQEEYRALVDADLHRLKFVFDNSVHPDKDSLYLNALRTLKKSYPGLPETAEVTFRIAEQIYRKGIPENNWRSSITWKAGEKRNLRKINLKLKEIIQKYPQTEGASHAKALSREIEQKELSIQTEEVVIPGKNIRALLTYRNTEWVHLYVFQVPNDRHTMDQPRNAQWLSYIEKATPVWKASVRVPGSADMETHRTEVKIDSLSAGKYILIASLNEKFNKNENIISSSPFQVSSIATITQRTSDRTWVYTLDRENGEPLPGIRTVFWQKKWNNNTRKYYYVRTGSTVTNTEGVLQITGLSDFQSMTLYRGTDTLQTELNHRKTVDRKHEEKRKEKTFFFTDRSIYRPGQLIHFKGIIVESYDGGKSNKVHAGKNTKVALYDPNNQKVDSVLVTTNEFGSFTGTFSAPENGLNGSIRIVNESGSVSISVEEYKRPKFYVKFDTLSIQYALGEQIKLKGQARSYAGPALGQAQVRYRVIRKVRYPYKWASYSRVIPTRSPEMEVSNGTTQAGNDGEFEISFTTLPDRSIDPETMPVFTYEVHVDVTDVNGETQSATESVQAGYRAMQISASLPEKALASQMDTLSVRTTTLDGTFTPVRITMKIMPLTFPGKIYRGRVWDQPDKFLYSKDEFHHFFPDDAYGQEDDYHHWDAEQPVLDTTWTSSANAKVSLPSAVWAHSGWYLFEFSGIDKNGKKVLEKKYAYILIPESKEQVQLPLIASASEETYRPGEVAQVWVKSGLKNAVLLEGSSEAVSQGARIVHADLHYSKKITEEDRGGVYYTWVTVQNNRVYTTSATLTVPWTNRDLNIKWSTHRSNLKPGEKEEWTMTIEGARRDAVTAEMVATLYDASLDAFKPHKWMWSPLIPQSNNRSFWGTTFGFGLAPQYTLKSWPEIHSDPYKKRYDLLNTFGLNPEYMMREEVSDIRIRGIGKPLAAGIAQKEQAPMSDSREVLNYSANTDGNAGERPGKTEQVVPLRTNLQETAFFFPQLRTDTDGNIHFRFSAPEALTTWNLMAFAHTPDWKTGFLEGRIRTQKDLMVTPNLPRFFRQGDTVIISSKISNLSEGSLNGRVRIELLDALTQEPLTEVFKIFKAENSFSLKTQESSALSWKLSIPDSLFNPIIVRVSAQSDQSTDGEEHLIPVVTNRKLVTETLPLWVPGNKKKNFSWERIAREFNKSHVDHSLIVEFSGNPAWYAVQALPYLTEQKQESAESIFNRFYANALAGLIAEARPEILKTLNDWSRGDSTMLKSNLRRNEDLKSTLLEETPWVMEARSEEDQKQQIVRLFNADRLSAGLSAALSKLADTQLENGGFPWFKGMPHNRYITQYILTGIGRLKNLDATTATGKALTAIVKRGLAYTDAQIRSDYKRLLDSKADLSKQQISFDQIFYLYMRSFFYDQQIASDTEPAFKYYRTQAAKYWTSFNPYMKGQIALALHRFGDTTLPQQILASLKETAIISEEFGMYWKNQGPGYYWYQAPVETQSLLIEAFSEIGKDILVADDLKIWLLKQKQTQHWNTSKSTADACYALLIEGTDWLASDPEVVIEIGEKTIVSSENDPLAGTGYFRTALDPEDIEPEMQHISVQVRKPEDRGTAWGGIYWQYFENLDQIENAESPLSIKKELYLVQNTERGPELIKIGPGNELRVGDKVTVRIEIRTDRDMDFVHLKDMRASALEPINVISSYKFQGGLGYLENTRDLSTNFFFDHIRKGTYVFEYPMYVSQSGNFSNGIATIQSMYAPEFSSHSKGVRISVRQN